jgi:hypothetical protein
MGPTVLLRELSAGNVDGNGQCTVGVKSIGGATVGKGAKGRRVNAELAWRENKQSEND